MINKRLMSWLLCFAMIVGMVPIPTFAATGITVDIKNQPSSDQAFNMIRQLFPDDLQGIEIKNTVVNYSGTTNYQIGSFSGAKGDGVNDILEFNDGVALSTGDLKTDLLYNPSASNPVTKEFGTSGTIGEEKIYDPASIEFDMIVSGDNEVIMQYAFASEEYMEYSLGEFNDKFAIFVNDINYAKVPGTNDSIAINTVNQVNNTDFFRPNSNHDNIKSLGLNIPMDGITKTFTASAKLNSGINHVKIIIGDKGDSSYDSVLFIKAKSFKLAKFDPGKLSIIRAAGGVKVVRESKDGTPAIDGTIAFSLVSEDFEQWTSEHVYFIEDGASEVFIPMENGQDHSEQTIPVETKFVSITKPQMGATLGDPTKLQLLLDQPSLSKPNKTSETLNIKGEPGATADLYDKDDQKINTVTLDQNGTATLTATIGHYYVVQTKDGINSLKSNTVDIVKPPYIVGDTGVFDELVLDKGSAAYDPASLDVTAFKADGTQITGSNFSMTHDVDTSKPGIYTVKWTATDSGFTVSKTKIVKVKPPVPFLFDKNYKDSEINIKGEPNAYAIIHYEGNILETIKLDGDGNGVIIDPPNGHYYVTQELHGVESDKASSELDINRHFTPPVIKLNGLQDAGYYKIDPVSGLAGHNMIFGDSYNEKGAVVNDKEDDEEPSYMSGTVNAYLTERVEIDNPMINSSGIQISVTNPALSGDGTAVSSYPQNFVPFVGKYLVNYRVKDTDDMESEEFRLIRVYPDVVTTSAAAINFDSSVEVDALSSASVFLYDENKKPLHFESGKTSIIAEEHLYQDEHTKIKMPAGASNDEIVNAKLSGLPDGTYYFRQRLYGLNSDFTSFTIERSDSYPLLVLNGEHTMVIEKGTVFLDPGYTVSDKEDSAKNIETKVSISGSVDHNKIGLYTIRYTAVDSDGHSVKAERIVEVRPNKPVVIVGNRIDGKFTPTPNGNDIKIEGEPNAILQIVEGAHHQAGLKERLELDAQGVAYFDDLPKNEGELEYAAIQTVDDLQSDKTYFNITKTNHYPVITLDQQFEVVKLYKGDSKIIDLTGVAANDVEDGDLTSEIRLYHEVEDHKLVGSGDTELSFTPTDTNKVGPIDYYYGVKDTDNNHALHVAQLAVHPNPPTPQIGETTITALDLEPDATVELCVLDEMGKLKLVETKHATGNSVTFENINTGVYVLKQIVNVYESKPSGYIAFNSPAYINGKLIDKDDNPIEGVEVHLEGANDIAEKTYSDGTFHYGVKSANKAYHLHFTHENHDFKLYATSSEDKNGKHVHTTATGALLVNGEVLHDDKTVVELYIKNDKGEFELSNHAKIHYEEGIYATTDLLPNRDYKVKVFHREDAEHLLPLMQFDVMVKESGVTKIINHNIDYGEVKNQSGDLLSGAKITLYYPDRDMNPDDKVGPVELSLVNELITKNSNGYITSANGLYGYLVYDNSEYVLVASKDGYKDYIKVIDSAHGQMINQDIVLIKGSNKTSGANDNGSSSSSSPTKVTKPSSKKDELLVISDDSKATHNDTTNKDNLPDEGYIHYDFKEIPNKIDVVEKPHNGRVYINPETGDVMYIPLQNKSGEDAFALKVKTKNGKTVDIDKTIEVSSHVNTIDKTPALVLELSADHTDVAVGQMLEFTAVVKNNYGSDIKHATIAVEIPKGFVAPEGTKVIDDKYIILDVNDIPLGQTMDINFELKAVAADVELEDLLAMVTSQEINQLSPQSVSSLHLKIFDVNKLYEVKPYIKGYPDGDFKKELPVKRSEATAMLIRALSEKSANASYPEFSDVKAEDWYHDYVLKAASMDLIHGYENGEFRPQKDITRAEFVKVIANYFKLDMSDTTSINAPFNDTMGHWASADINTLNRYGIINGYNDGSFKPNAPVTREEAVKIINELTYRLSLDDSEPSFKDVLKEQWSFGDIESAYRGYTFMIDQQGKMNLNTDN